MLKSIINGEKMKLYHYTDLKGIMGILQSKKIWATNAYYLNDSSEIQYSVAIAKSEAIAQKRNCDERTAKYLDDIISLLESFLDKDYAFVASFSEEPDLLSQWRAYGKGSGGFCIGLSEELLSEKSPDKDNFKVCKCSYDRDKQEDLVKEWLGDSIDQFNSGIYSSAPEDLSDMDAFIEFFTFALSLKEKSFAEEKEWRLISTLSWRDYSGIEFRQGESMIIPYYGYHLAEEGKNMEIEEIIIGPCPHKDLSKRSLEQVLSKYNVKCPRIYHSSIPFRASI